MGKGQNIKKGIEAAGGTPILIEGMLADMKLGDTMNEHQADLGLSFCGSGGAGAISAATKYGYKYKQYQRTVKEGVNCVKDGFQAIGFPFMDSEELGYEITKAWKEMHANE